MDAYKLIKADAEATEVAQIPVTIYGTSQLAQTEGAPTAGRIGDLVAKVTGVSSEISSEKLNASLKNFLGALQEGFADLPTVLSIFKLTEIELELEVSATGEVSWIIAGAEVEVKAGLKVKLERV